MNYKYFLILLIAGLSIQNVSAQWVKTEGPPMWGASEFAKNDSLIFAGTGVGIYVSKNNGQSWNSVNNSFASEPQIVSIALSRKTLFAVTRYEGLFSSQDFGLTWTSLNANLPQNISIKKIAVNDTNIFIGVEFYTTSNNGGVLKSTDNGLTWKLFNNKGWWTVNSLKVYGSHLFVGTDYGAHLSDDDGVTWRNTDPKYSDFPIYALYVSDTMLLSCKPNFSPNLYLSTNNGNSWSGIGLTLPKVQYNDIIIKDDNIYLATDYGLFVSNNKGETWSALTNGFHYPGNIGFSSLKVMGNLIFASGDGNYISDNNGLYWKPSNIGFPRPNPKISEVSPAVFGTRIMSTYLSYLTISKNNGKTWESAYPGINNIRSLVNNGKNDFAATVFMGIFRSGDGGNTWNNVSKGLPKFGDETYKYINSITSNGNDIWTIVDNTSLYKSTDNGENWINTFKVSGDTLIYCLAFQGKTILAGTNKGIIISKDDGQSWSLQNKGLHVPNQGYGGYKINYQIIPIENKILALLNDSIFLSADSGSSWKPIPLKQRISCFTVIDKNIFVGTFGQGVYMTELSGKTWKNLNYPGSTAYSQFIKSILAIGNTLYATNNADEPVCLQYNNVSKLYSSNVWPGDANGDGFANYLDVLPISVFYSKMGTSRSTISNKWESIPSLDWNIKQENGSDIKHSDCNGDGTINTSDLTAIFNNYGLSHNKTIAQTINNPGDPELKLIVKNQFLKEGDLIHAEIWTGSTSIPVKKMYGIGFRISYNSDIIEPNSCQFQFNKSWLEDSLNTALVLDTIFENYGIIDAVIARTNKLNKSGFGKIAEFQLKLKNIALFNSSFELMIDDYKAIDSSGNLVALNTSNGIAALVASGIQTKQPLSPDLNIFPNPSNGAFNINLKGMGNNKSVQLSLINVLGEKIFTREEVVSEDTSMPIEININPGVYWMQLILDKKIITKKVIIH